MMKPEIYFLLIAILLLSCSKEKKANKAGEKMQEFVISISDYSRQIDPDFIVIPQNGPELAFKNLDPNDGEHSGYMAAINGFGVEELFYNGDYSLDPEQLLMLQQLVPSKKIMVAEFVSHDANVNDAIQRNLDEGFICFPRINSNYDYQLVPDSAIQENSKDILSLSDTKNYLYLISTDNFSSKQEMINTLSTNNFDLLLIDLFFDSEIFTAADIQQLKTKANGGQRLVISYMNIGAAENYRYYWKSDWKLHHPKWLKKSYDGYEDEIWVEFWEGEWQEIIFGNNSSYTKKILDAGFDGVYLDNVEGYYFLYFE